MATNEELRKQIRVIVDRLVAKDATGTTYSLRDIRLELSTHFGLDLRPRRSFISDQVRKMVSALQSNQEEDEEPLMETKRVDAGGLDKLYELSDIFKRFTGHTRMTHSEVQKYLADYVVNNDLLEDDKVTIACDIPLKRLFRKEKLSIYNLHKIVTQHIYKMDPEDDKKSGYNIGRQDQGRLERLGERGERGRIGPKRL